MSYELLYTNEGKKKPLFLGGINPILEIRKYPPHKRTLKIAGSYYFLQFPHAVYMRRLRGYSVNLGVGFTDEIGKTLYSLPILSGFDATCLDLLFHFNFPLVTPFEDLISLFWQNEFPNLIASYSNNKAFKSYKDWANMSLAQVIENMKTYRSIVSSAPRELTIP